MAQKKASAAKAPGQIHYSGKIAQTVLNSLSAHIAILDKEGTILETNLAWREYATRSGMPADYDWIGINYLEICAKTEGQDRQDARSAVEGLQAVLDGRKKEFLLDYPCHSPEGKHWYYMRVARIPGKGLLRAVVSHEDITALKLTEEALRKNREALDLQKQSLEEANIALKVLLKHRQDDKEAMEKNMLANIKQLVFPYVEKLKRAPLKPKNKTLVEIIETHLNDVISPLLQRMVHADIILTPQEMQVMALVKDGRTSKEIATILNVSETTVHFHRKNLRKKFNLSNTRTNLRSYLLSLS